MLAALAPRARGGLAVSGSSLFVLVAGAGLFGLSVFALRGLLEIREALRVADLSRANAPEFWPLTRIWSGAAPGVLVLLAASRLGAAAWLAGAAIAALGYRVAPEFLLAARRRVEQEVLDDLPVHLDLIAVGLEARCSLPAALALCAERAPAGALKRAWSRVVLEIHHGMDPLEALRAPPRMPTPAQAAGVLYIALAASVLAFWCWNRGVAIVGANAAGFTLHLLPLFGTGLAIVFLEERFQAFHAAGFAAILAGVVVATLAPGPASPLPAAGAGRAARTAHGTSRAHTATRLPRARASAAAWSGGDRLSSGSRR